VLWYAQRDRERRKGKTLIRLRGLPCARVNGDGRPDGGTGDA
jgi:hypothetical protein